MERKFDFGKIDYYGKGRKINKVEVTVSLSEYGCFTASAIVWNNKHSNVVIGGQCLDELLPFFKGNEKYLKIYNWWSKYHLNDMHPGTEAQEKALEEVGLTRWASNYKECCEYLESIGLLVDNDYRFGTGWLKREIPSDDLQEIKKLLGE